MMNLKFKKYLALACALVMNLSIVGCSGEEELADPAMIQKEVASVSMLVPNDYEDFVIQDGAHAAPGPNSSIVVSDVFPTDITMDVLTQETMLDWVSGGYENIELLSFESPITIAGTDAVSITFTGNSYVTGDLNTVTYVIRLFEQDGVAYEQDFAFTYAAEKDSSLKDTLPAVLESISAA